MPVYDVENQALAMSSKGFFSFESTESQQMNKENRARVEPSFLDADDVARPSVETAVPMAMGRAEPELTPQGSPHAEAQAGPQDAALVGRKSPVKSILMGVAGVLIAGLIGTIALLSSKAGEQRLRPPEQMAVAAPAGMSAKILPMPEAHALDPVRDVPSAMLPPSQPQVPVAPPPLPVSASPAPVQAPAPAQAAPAESAAPLAAAAIAPMRAVGPVAAQPVKPKKHVVPKAATSKVKKPAKVVPVKDGRKGAALKPAPARKVAAKTAPRCDAHNRNLPRCRTVAKAGRT
jgi:hypothetical protein